MVGVWVDVDVCRFLFGGGDGCASYSEGKRLSPESQEVKVAAVFAAYLALPECRVLSPKVEGRLVLSD
jgi:hypothetical protein